MKAVKTVQCPCIKERRGVQLFFDIPGKIKIPFRSENGNKKRGVIRF
jgi:hypothetical protein